MDNPRPEEEIFLDQKKKLKKVNIEYSEIPPWRRKEVEGGGSQILLPCFNP